MHSYQVEGSLVGYVQFPNETLLVNIVCRCDFFFVSNFTWRRRACLRFLRIVVEDFFVCCCRRVVFVLLRCSSSGAKVSEDHCLCNFAFAEKKQKTVKYTATALSDVHSKGTKEHGYKSDYMYLWRDRMTVFGIVRFKRQASRAFPRAAVASRQLLGLAQLTGQHHDGLDVVIEDLQTWRRAR